MVRDWRNRATRAHTQFDAPFTQLHIPSWTKIACVMNGEALPNASSLRKHQRA